MRKIVILSAFLMSLQVWSQRIQNFHAFVAGNQVGIRFTITAGPQCSGYTIYHSTDSLNYFQIENYAGVCGDISSDQQYSYTHSSPAPEQINYYKVEVSGGGISPVTRIFVGVNPRATISVFPNPLGYPGDLLNMRVFNVSNVRLVGAIYNQTGKPVKYIDLLTQGENAQTPVYELDNGLYILWLNDGENVFSARFIVKR